MTEVVFSLETLLAQSVLSSQQKTNYWLRTPGKMMFGRIFDVLPFSSPGENSVAPISPGENLGISISHDENVGTPISSRENSGIPISHDENSGPVIFSPWIKAKELKFLEDDNVFLGLEKVGRGGCGQVFKAHIRGGIIKMIAIKRIVTQRSDLIEEDEEPLYKKMGQIQSEIQTVGQIRHRNFLFLLAHVSRPTCHYLVYEYMKNGSLQDIFQPVHNGRRELDWLMRHKIAIGVASGLEYLHMSHTPRIVHRDLKPGNVLLDDDEVARIADIGLSGLIPDSDTHMSDSFIGGTLGYIAPAYHQTMKFTDKCDIYSFGMILGVLVVGKLPSDEFFQHTDEMSMVRWMRNVMTSDDPRNAIDPILLGNGYEKQMLLVLKIACFCTMQDPKQRPNSKDCGIMLSQIQH